MKKFIVFIFIGMLIQTFLTAPTARAQSRDIQGKIETAFSQAGIPFLKQSRPINDFTLPLLDGKNVKLSGLKGKVVFLNFWATWCPPCREEMPSMEVLYKRYRDKGLEFLAVDIMEKKEQVSSFMKDFGLSFPAALDSSGDVSGMYGIRGIPTTFIIDRQGRIIVASVGGREWNTPAMLNAFDLLLSDGK
ncbi:MAG: TlpA family protein disulfide reductase [Treponema sp.]|jgi:thiol-disulfide isomerase/thioredoxin|nr:TlpA family protein disulfide reductase [Treponema sp.]